MNMPRKGYMIQRCRSYQASDIILSHVMSTGLAHNAYHAQPVAITSIRVWKVVYWARLEENVNGTANLLPFHVDFRPIIYTLTSLFFSSSFF